VVPEAANPQMHELTATFGKEVQRVVKEYLDAMEKVRLKAGLKAAMNASSLGNLYLQDSKFWKLYKEDPPACAVVLKTAVGLVHLLATLLEPFMPSFSHKVLLSVVFPSPPDIRLKHNMFQQSHSKFYVIQVHLS
jgi:methionyl-tRNA synthetase